MVQRPPIGAGRRNAGQHSQTLENFFCHFPGLKVVAPCTARDAKGMLKSAIRDDDPVIFLEHKLLYARKEEIPEGEYLIPLGQAEVKREGTDLTIITWSREVNFSLEAAETLAAAGISARVLDMHTIKPLDTEAVTACVNDIGKIITVEDHNILNGLGSAVCEVAAEKGKGIVKRIGIQDQFGQSAPYERLLAINGITVENIVETAKALVK